MGTLYILIHVNNLFTLSTPDTIQCVLDNHDAHRPNVTVFSNKMVFDDNGVLTGFSEPVVHSYNKGTAAVSMEDMKKVSVCSYNYTLHLHVVH